MREPGQVAFNLTPAMKRALHMVNNGDIVRVYTKDGNVFRKRTGGAGVSFRVLWVLANHRLIEDGESTDGVTITTTMKLSKAGQAVLNCPGNSGRAGHGKPGP